MKGELHPREGKVESSWWGVFDGGGGVVKRSKAKERQPLLTLPELHPRLWKQITWN